MPTHASDSHFVLWRLGCFFYCQRVLVDLLRTCWARRLPRGYGFVFACRPEAHAPSFNCMSAWGACSKFQLHVGKGRMSRFLTSAWRWAFENGHPSSLFSVIIITITVETLNYRIEHNFDPDLSLPVGTKGIHITFIRF